MQKIQQISAVLCGLFEGLLAAQCFNDIGGYYANLYVNTQYCAFGCCGEVGNITCCSVIAPVIGIAIGVITFIIILIVVICCCRKFAIPSLKEMHRKPDKYAEPLPTLGSLPDSSFSLNRSRTAKNGRSNDIEHQYSSDDSRISDVPKRHQLTENRQNHNRKSDRYRRERRKSFESEDYLSQDSEDRRDYKRSYRSKSSERYYDSEEDNHYSRRSNSRRHRDDEMSRKDGYRYRYEENPQRYHDEYKQHSSRRSRSSSHRQSQHSESPPYRERY